MSLLNSEFVSVLASLEATFGVQSAQAWGAATPTGWMQFQPNQGGIQDFYAQLTKIARSPMSSNLMDEKGKLVDLTGMPKLVHDLNKDVIDRFGESVFRTTTKYPGGTGVGLFYPTAVTATGYTVPAGGALTTNTLIYASGFTNAANNGLRVVTASIATEVRSAALVVEAGPPTGARIEVVGYQGAAADLAINAGGNLTSAATVLASLGLNAYSWIWIGGGTAATPGALGFATAADRGFARITAVAAGTLTLDRKTQAFSADTGAGKTIQIFFGPWLRNVPGTHADYKRPSHSLELYLPRLAAGPADAFVYGLGGTMGTFDLSAPLTDKIIATMGFVCSDVTDPTITRATGASTALTPQKTTALTTANEMRRVRVCDASNETVIINDIQAWGLQINNNVSPYRRQGTLGAVDMIFGKFQVGLSIDGSLAQPDLWQAARDNRTCTWDAATYDGLGGYLWDLPALTVEAPAPQFAAEDVVRISPTSKTFRDSTSGFVLGVTHFPYLPTS